MLTQEETIRYSRHLLLEDVGTEGQEKIKSARILIVGAGGLGSPVALYLAAAGVGTLGIIDGDNVDLTNLQRQVIHQTKDVGTPKVLSAKEKIVAINPNVRVEAMQDLLTADNAHDILSEYQFVIDATDNYDTKFLINDICVSERKPYSHGAIRQYDGETFTYLPGTTCYRCLFGAPPPPGTVKPASQIGLFGAIAGMLGTIQAAEALKYITGVGDLLTNQLLTFDARTMNFNKIGTFRNPNCHVCGG